jgi:hypothetical protein
MKEETLKKVERDIASGDLGKARDRLHGLLATFPGDLSLRRRLGDLYALLHEPAMAGRYWYLEESPSPAMEAACRTFERSCGDDPVQILRTLKFREDPTLLGETARERLLALQEEARHEGYRPFPAPRLGQPSGRRGSGWLLAGCVLALVAAAFFTLVGLVTAWQWIFSG